MQIDLNKWYTVKTIADEELLFGYKAQDKVQSKLDNGFTSKDGTVIMPKVVTDGNRFRKIQGQDLIDFIDACKNAQ